MTAEKKEREMVDKMVVKMVVVRAEERDVK